MTIKSLNHLDAFENFSHCWNNPKRKGGMGWESHCHSLKVLCYQLQISDTPLKKAALGGEELPQPAGMRQTDMQQGPVWQHRFYFWSWKTQLRGVGAGREAVSSVCSSHRHRPPKLSGRVDEVGTLSWSQQHPWVETNRHWPKFRGIQSTTPDFT